ncbi:MAG: glycine--tRNA ligase subunit beta, partial [Chlamydiia bacterium]|nr:glycine--tRNA ligase subunit beta [Chlamydiia bacterium]
LYLQNVESFFDIQWNDQLTYGDIYHRNEVEWSHYNFEEASTRMWFQHFDDYEKEARQLVEKNLPIPAYDFVMKASHAFNMLDARGVISVTERTGYIQRIRDLACEVAREYLESRKELEHPLMDRFSTGKRDDIHLTHPELTLNEALLQATSKQKEDYLLEIGSEELPATFVPAGCHNLEKSMVKLLEKEGIQYEGVETYGTPRRLAVYVKGLQMATPTTEEERRGPPVNQAFDDSGLPAAAAQGFFRSINKDPLTLNEIRDGQDSDVSIVNKKGTDYLCANVVNKGRPVADILSEKVPDLILNLDFPKKMRWGDLEISYARPLRWIVSLFGKHRVRFTVGDITADRESYGHSQLHPWSFALLKAQDYLPILRDHYVIADMKERRREIVRQLDELERSLGAAIIKRDAVIPQVLNLVEWPQCTVGTFDKAFLKAPKEVLISEMVEHQKYFPVAREDGQLKNSFVITADNKPTEKIRHGNERALTPRLADGVSLYELDLSVSLEEFNEKLKHVTFQKELGSVYDKVMRIKKHAALLQKMLNISTPENTERAALFCKVDIPSKMVYEFPELQGVMGRYYALARDEAPEVAQAIDEHWMPRGEDAPLPATETGIIISLADKIDNLLGCFCVGLKPTSSSDPYALRRQALGMMRILIENRLHLPISKLIGACYDNFPEEIRTKNSDAVVEIEEFLVNRIKTVFQHYGVAKDEIDASLSSGFSDIYDTFCKVQALHRFRESGDKFPLLYEVYKRAKGQVDSFSDKAFSTKLLKENAEVALDQVLNRTELPFTEALKSHEYDQAYALIAEIQPAIADLFDQVKVLADDAALRDNRIALLQRVFSRFDMLLDFAKIKEK